MNSVRPNASLRPAPAAEPDPISPLEIISFILASARRHLAFAALVATLVAAIGAAVVYAIPPIYESTTKVFLNQDNSRMVSLTVARRAEEYERPLQGLQESVLNDDNLLALVREAHLAATWERTRNTWALRWKDAFGRWMGGSIPVSAVERSLVEMLKSSIFVTSEANTSVRFTVVWRDAQDAYNLVRLCSRNFMAGRSRDQFSAIQRAIELLEKQLEQADAAVPPALHAMQEVVQRTREASAMPKPPPAGATPRAPVRTAVAPPPALVDGAPVSSEMLQETRRAAREVAEPWQRRLADLQFQMAELRTIFGPEHPQVRAQEARIAAASETPSELVRLRDRESQIIGALASTGGISASSSGSARPGGAQGSSGITVTLERSEDPEVAAARTRVEGVLSKSRELSARLDASRLELATAQAGEKYRYTIVEAPEIAKKPIKPKRPVMLLGAIALALVLGLLAGAARELVRGKVLEAWQIRMLGVHVLGEVQLTDVRERRLKSRSSAG